MPRAKTGAGAVTPAPLKVFKHHRLQKHIGKIDSDTAAQVRAAIALLYATA